MTDVEREEAARCETHHSLAEALPQEQARCRELLAIYRSIGPAGAFAAAHIEESLRRADQASAAGDVAAMVSSYMDLKGKR